MTDKQRLEKRMSEHRSAIRNLAMAERDEAQDAQLAELRAKLEADETSLQAVIEAGDVEVRESPIDSEDVGEQREYRSMLGKARVMNFTARNGNHGVEAEIRAEAGLPDNGFPLDMLVADVDGVEVEHRAIVATPAATDREQPRTWLQRLFSDSVLGALRVGTRSVAPGQPMFTEITGGGDAQLLAKSADTTDSTFSYKTTKITPVRHSITALAATEDYDLYGGLEAEVRRDLRAAFAEDVSRKVVNEATRWDGLMDALTFGNAPAGVVGFGDVEDWVFDNIDGLYARNEGDISFVMNPSIYKVLGKARRQTGAAATDLEDATTALQYLRNMSGGVTSSLHMPAGTANVANFVGVKSRPEPAAVLAIWRNATITDEITGATRGEVRYTMFTNLGFRVVREEAYVPLRAKIA